MMAMFGVSRRACGCGDVESPPDVSNPDSSWPTERAITERRFRRQYAKLRNLFVSAAETKPGRGRAPSLPLTVGHEKRKPGLQLGITPVTSASRPRKKAAQLFSSPPLCVSPLLSHILSLFLSSLPHFLSFFLLLSPSLFYNYSLRPFPPTPFSLPTLFLPYLILFIHLLPFLLFLSNPLTFLFPSPFPSPPPLLFFLFYVTPFHSSPLFLPSYISPLFSYLSYTSFLTLSLLPFSFPSSFFALTLFFSYSSPLQHIQPPYLFLSYSFLSPPTLFLAPPQSLRLPSPILQHSPGLPLLPRPLRLPSLIPPTLSRASTLLISPYTPSPPPNPSVSLPLSLQLFPVPLPLLNLSSSIPLHQPFRLPSPIPQHFPIPLPSLTPSPSLPFLPNPSVSLPHPSNTFPCLYPP
ncbi:hypothetical protein C7M84_021510 [Penaeus vannamei]|uniref:Uncharacterized protein n=1 Tax=Penaeus vannamei TaxID=6689 RepID=A0A423U8K8_PENVA|nr:hypothetical protein C7M84_021510 [Penaeus vannamei]